MTEIPEPVRNWLLADQVRWILRQPDGEETKTQLIVNLVRAEKEKTAEVAQSIFFHPRKQGERE